MFLSPLDTRAYRPKESVLLRKFGYQFELDGKVAQLWTPRAFVTDFGSMPWLVQCLPGFSVNGPSRPGSIPHDYLYCCHGSVEVTFIDESTGVAIDRSWEKFDRSQCDEIFRQAILDIGGDPYTKDLAPHRYSKAQARMFWSGVRAGGWYYWNKRKNGIDLEYDFAVEFLSGDQLDSDGR